MIFFSYIDITRLQSFQIKLVVIDSISFLIRNNIANSLERIQKDHIILTRLHILAQQYKCAVGIDFFSLVVRKISYLCCSTIRLSSPTM